ncbi:hypothetical protein BT67DRAFT_437834 [Trichocladium antarcticum]|uniref:Uncharacterized protein n=1 Tax=Trichocladium antarcticum TaxID=1450529 RepID=A0AAN6ZHW6_9PEZI|nr:hypothetical protein BT67DRAFT_437834 [Trichocladium antarcticum]
MAWFGLVWFGLGWAGLGCVILLTALPFGRLRLDWAGSCVLARHWTAEKRVLFSSFLRRDPQHRRIGCSVGQC